MEKRLDGKSLDNIQKRIEELKMLFPEAVQEGCLDRDILLTLLGDEFDNEAEKYRFEWKGKQESLLLAQKRSSGTLRPMLNESKNWDSTRNLYIEGDNLEVLKLLQQGYLRQVKMIYIDPPYNTGNDFVYKDDYKDPLKGYKEATSQSQRAHPETAGRYHSAWLSVMYPRLKIAKTLLRDDGVIFISIDDNEVHNLRKLCDEVFGEENFVGDIIWQTATDNNPRQISTEHEYILCYAKNILEQGKWLIKSSKANLIMKKHSELADKYGNNVVKIAEDLKKWINSNENNLKGVSHYSYVDNKGVYYPGNSSNTKPGGYMFDIIHPETNKVCAKPEFGYRWALETFNSANERGDVEWGKDETTIPKIKKRIETATEMLKSYYYEDNRYWTKYLSTLFGNKRIFENPKSVNLVCKFVNFTTSSSDLILDFFSGSGTTAHAVMQLNAEDGGHRRYIMVQLDEKTDEHSEAYKAGYKTIAEIGRERIRRAGDKIISEHPELEGKLDIGFRSFKLDTSNLKKWDDNFADMDREQQAATLLDRMENSLEELKPDRREIDVIYEVFLKYGVALTEPLSQLDVEGKKFYAVGEDGYLFICLDKGITVEVIESLLKDYTPGTMIFADQSFLTDDEITNTLLVLQKAEIEFRWI